MSISVTVAEVSPRATARAFRTICISICEVVALGLVWDPPSSAASRAACRTAYPPVTRSAIMTVASKPPMSRKKSTGMTTAISASDCPRCVNLFFISVALRLQPHPRHGRRPYRAESGEKPRFPVVGVIDGDADEVAGSVSHVALGRRPWLRRDHRRAIQRVAVVVEGVRGQVAVAILVELVDIDFGDVEEPRGADVASNHRQDLAIGRGRIAQLRSDPGALRSGVAG